MKPCSLLAIFQLFLHKYNGKKSLYVTNIQNARAFQQKAFVSDVSDSCCNYATAK